jgi:transcriptional regulator with XRE-family HTH domain
VVVFLIPHPRVMNIIQTSIKDFRTHLGMIREKKGITQSELSRYTGLTVSHIQALENGNDEPELEILITLADSLEVEIKGLA